MSLTRISIRQFEVFAMVAETRGFGAAGERMGLSSSAVSQLVAELESNLGFRVFDRSTRRVELSGAGRDFLPSAQSVLRDVQRGCAVGGSGGCDTSADHYGLGRDRAPGRPSKTCYP